MKIELVLQPGAARNRSMQLYAQRLFDNQPTHQTWTIRRLPELPLLPEKFSYRLSEILLPPLTLPFSNADVVHIVDHSHAGYARYCRGNVVVTVHDLIPLKWLGGEYPTTEKMSRIAEHWFRWNIRALDKAAAIVCPSQATANDVKRLCGLDAEVIHNGIDRVFFDAPAPAVTQKVRKRIAHLKGPKLLQVSSGFFYKNEAMFREVFLQLAKEIEGLCWIKLGSPLSQTDRRALARANLEDRVLEYGSAPVQEVAAIYRHVDALFFPSLDEGFGWPPVEAMAAGCPVVASNAGALAETAAPAGLTTTPEDLDGHCAHLGKVLNHDSVRQKLIAAGKQHAASFAWQSSAQQFSDLYQRL